jgi:hypothetical protein
MSGVAVFLWALGVYVAVGAVTALAFVTVGVTRVLEHPAPVTVGARILFIPAATALWPLVLRRWLKAGHRP